MQWPYRNCNNKPQPQPVFDNIQAFLKQDQIFDKIEAEINLAEINAQLGNKHNTSSFSITNGLDGDFWQRIVVVTE